ncbi:hypothetical protein [Lysinibacillus sp. FSL K6-0102]|uniref:hypothetical protein n=1 Tax=Lysinibacillus sp. FSL K6-0102 TaxID=2975290 RepID=UPI0030F5EB32
MLKIKNHICIKSCFLERLGFSRDSELRYVKISEDGKWVKVGVNVVVQEDNII